MRERERLSGRQTRLFAKMSVGRWLPMPLPLALSGNDAAALTDRRCDAPRHYFVKLSFRLVVVVAAVDYVECSLARFNDSLARCNGAFLSMAK